MKQINFQQALRSLHSGNLVLTPFVVLGDGKKVFANTIFTEKVQYQTAQFVTEYEGIFRDKLQLQYKDGEIIGKRKFENLSGEALSLKELGIELSGITYGKDAKEDYFYHTENPRIYEYMTFPVDYIRSEKDAMSGEFDAVAGNRWADPGVVGERIGASPYQPFPAILVSNYQTKYGLVHGTLSQDVCFHNYLVRHENEEVTLDIFSSFKGVDALEVAPGRVIVDEWYLGYTAHADNIERLFEGYADVLRKKLPVSYGRTDLNRRYLLWGSWNDGLWWNVTENLLLTEAKFLRENFPTVRWVQLDSGYSVLNEIIHGLGVPYEGEEGVDYNKFPQGLRHYSDEIREMGLTPAIWIGLYCPTKSKIYQENPQWFLDYTYRMEETQPLDVSQSAVRDYIETALETLCRKYGFESVKLDFWSYAFEDSHNLFANKEHSGYEYRRWFFNTLRSYLPHDAYLQCCCDLSMGNPFLGEFVTNYRYGIDIGTGEWDKVKFTYRLGTACIANHVGDLCVPNSDSIGLFPGLNRTEAMFCINYCIATHSLVEIAGRLSQVTDDSELRVLKKAVCNPNNGQDVYFIDYDYRNNNANVAEIMYFKTPHFSCQEDAEGLPVRTLALFNLDDEEKSYSVCLEDMGLEKGIYVLTDVWSGQQYECDGTYSDTVEAHGSRLLAVSRRDGIQLYDANIRINVAKVEDNRLTVETDYAFAEAELLLHDVPSKLFCNGEEMKFTVIENSVICFDIPEKGKLELWF